ncbi:alpha/beta hydrolase family protein [Falsiroseomonas sp.]|uniref:alpha/beta hydrolase family protein n=1 Tax=Falsiroseomonas sp. TaxID=2870721 RepID=UPI003F71AAAB
MALTWPIRRLDSPLPLAAARLLTRDRTILLPLAPGDTSLSLPPGDAAREPAVLALETVRAAPPTTADKVIFLSGDSRPKDANFGAALQAALCPYLEGTVENEGSAFGIPPEEALPRSFAERQDWLREVITEAPEPGRLILMGRSSGARIASTLADLRPIRALVCLGYPFHKPSGPDEPERYAHLPALRTPTLILQGLRDPYGGADIPGRYALSASTELVLLDTDHGFRGEAGIWDRAAREILLFLGHRTRATG